MLNFRSQGAVSSCPYAHPHPTAFPFSQSHVEAPCTRQCIFLAHRHSYPIQAHYLNGTLQQAQAI